MNNTKTNIFFSTLSIIIVMFGYQFVTTLFGSSMTTATSRSITIPYRLFALAVLIITWILNRNTKSNSKSVRILWIYWALLLFRMFFDFYVRTDIPPISRDQRTVFVLLNMTEAVIPSIVFSKCYKHIDFDKLLIWSFIITSASVLIAMFINTSAFITGEVGTGERLTANAALNSISTGNLGLMAIIVAIELLRKHKLSFFLRIFVYFMIFLDFVFMLRAGSRGPMFSGFVVMIFVVLTISKNKAASFALLLVSGIIFWLSLGFLESVISDISPVLYERLYGGSLEDQFYGRDNLYSLAFSYFLESPIWGKYFALYLNGEMVWPHNILIESLLQLGIIGFIFMMTIIVKSCIKVLSIGRSKASYFWLALILIVGVSGGMISTTFCMNSKISPLYALLFMPIESQNYSILKRKQ